MLTFVRCTYQVTVVTKAAGEPQLRWMSEEASYTHRGYTHHGYTRLGYTHHDHTRLGYTCRGCTYYEYGYTYYGS